jgi:hypothetical protein
MLLEQLVGHREHEDALGLQGPEVQLTPGPDQADLILTEGQPADE